MAGVVRWFAGADPEVKMTRKTAPVVLGIFPNMQIAKVRQSLPEVVALCRRLKIQAVLPEKLAAAFDTAAYATGRGKGGAATNVALDTLTAAVSLGGDGTFLQMARRLMTKKPPVFGVNFGHLGFLAEVEYQQLPQTLQRLKQGDYQLEKRNLLQAEVRQADGKRYRDLALNEFVLARGPLAKLAHLELALDGKKVGGVCGGRCDPGYRYRLHGLFFVSRRTAGRTGPGRDGHHPYLRPRVKRPAVSGAAPGKDFPENFAASRRTAADGGRTYRVYGRRRGYGDRGEKQTGPALFETDGAQLLRDLAGKTDPGFLTAPQLGVKNL
jgi:hypothetical protein